MLKQHKIRGLESCWLEEGNTEAPILLFLHGYPDSADTWENQVAHFKDRFHVVCPYLRGTHPSEPSKDVQRYGQDAIVLDCLEILQKIDPSGAKRIVCVGHDLGAVHAWNLSQCISDRLDALVVLNGLSIPQMIQRLKLPIQHLKSWYIYLIQIPYLPEIFLRSIPKLKDFPVPPINQYRAFVREVPQSVRRSHKKMQNPVLVLWGEQDPFLMAPTLDEFTPYASFPTVRIIEGSHWIHRDKKDEVNQIVDRFLSENES